MRPNKPFNVAGATKSIAGLQKAGRNVAATRLQNKVNRYNAQQPAVPAPAPTPAPAPAPTPAPETPVTPAVEPQFKPIEDFLAANPEGDAMYKQEMNLGEDRLKKYMAAKGLAGSGADVTAYQNMANQAASNQVGRGLQTAATNAGRYDQFNQSNFDNSRATGNDQFGRVYDMLSLMAAQSPMNSAFAATQGISNSLDGQGKSIGSAIGSNYFNQPTGGGGGGGGQVNPFIPNFTGSGVNAGYAGSSNASNINFADIISRFLGGSAGKTA
jgi:hypothetical protein